MKRVTLGSLSVLVVVIISSAQAFGSLNSFWGDGNHSFGYGTYIDSGTNSVDLSAGMSTHVGDITWVDVGFDYTGGTTVYVNEDISGRMGFPANDTPNQGQTTYINIDGKSMTETVNLYIYDANSGGGKGVVSLGADTNTSLVPPAADWWVNGSTDVNFSGFGISSISATGNYSEYPDSYDGITYTSLGVSWDITFNTPAEATAFVAESSPVSTAAVPEPASLSLLGIASLSLLQRRRSTRCNHG